MQTLYCVFLPLVFERLAFSFSMDKCNLAIVWRLAEGLSSKFVETWCILCKTDFRQNFLRTIAPPFLRFKENMCFKTHVGAPQGSDFRGRTRIAWEWAQSALQKHGFYCVNLFRRCSRVGENTIRRKIWARACTRATWNKLCTVKTMLLKHQLRSLSNDSLCLFNDFRTTPPISVSILRESIVSPFAPQLAACVAPTFFIF